MEKLNKLFDLCEEEGIIVRFTKALPDGVLGLYLSEPNLPTIISIDNTIENNNMKLLEVLAEEVGHHFTTSGSFVGPLLHYRDRLSLNKMEEKAMRWATRYLIPENELMDALKSGITSTEDLCSKLGVSKDILMQHLSFLAREKNSISFGNNILILSNLPNLYIMKTYSFI